MPIHDMTKYLSPDYIQHIFLDLMQMQEFMKEPLVMKRADGVWYEDVAGKRYLDGLSGIFAVNLGHNNRRVIEAIKRQLDEICFAPPLYSTNPSALELAKLLSEVTPEDLKMVKLLSGGSEATEAAIKMARQYHRQNGNPGKYKVISRYYGFHGTTMGALSATGFPNRKHMFEPTLTGFVKVFPPTCYRCPYKKEYPECGIFCATVVEDIIKFEAPENVAAFITEPIGNTGGIITPPPEYHPILREICNKYNVLLIFDEIITGFGRTGQMFAAQTFKTTPDILCMGKGMSGGYAPLAGIAFRESIAKTFWGKEEEHVEFAEGHTFGGNPVSSIAGVACIKEIQERDLCGRSRKMGSYLWKQLEGLKDLGVVGEIRGKGLLIGMEFVRNQETKESFDPNIRFGVKVGRTALKKGLIIRYDPNWVAFAPPLIVTEDEINQMVEIFTSSLKEVIQQVKH